MTGGMLLGPGFMSDGGWWSVRHQRTEQCTSGMLSAATTPSTAAYRAARSPSSNIPRSRRYPTYMTKRTATVVRRPYHVHHVPHVRSPQMDPVAIVRPDKTTPT